MADLSGQTLGRYHILEQLGEGGMAIVYKAYDTRLERDVAIKIIRKGAFPADHIERILKRFEREAKALARLSHPNILKIHDYGEHEGSPYLVMEYLPGGTLKQKMGRPIPWKEAIQLLLPIAEALDYAHSQNMIHRDVKPANILLTQRGQPMLTDFGIAKVLDLEETLELTGTSAALGTPEYMAPEQATAKSVDHRADIYSLGVVLYEMVTGRKPFIADTPMAVLIKHATESLPRPRQFVPKLPDEVEKVLLKALAKQPENRYQNMKELVSAIKKMLDVKKTIEKTDYSKVKKGNEKAELIKSIAKFFAVLKPTLVPTKSFFRIISIIGIIIVIFWVGLLVKTSLPMFVPNFNQEPTSILLNTPTAPTKNLNPFYFTANREGKTDIFAIKTNGDVVPLLNANRQGDNWSPISDGQGKVYFTSNHDGKFDIYVLNGKGVVVRLLRADRQGDNWSPIPDKNGNIYFTSNQDGKTDIYALNTKGIVVRLLSADRRGDNWSPISDGQGKVYFTSNHDGKVDIYVLNGKGIVVRLLRADRQGDNWSPIPDGKGNVYFTSNHDGKPDIYALNTKGIVVRLLRADRQGDNWSPVPDGKGNIYFTSDHGGKPEVFILNTQSKVDLMDSFGVLDISWTGTLTARYPIKY